MQYGQLHHVEYYVNDLDKTKEFWGWFLPKLDYSEFQKWDRGVSYAHNKIKTYLVFVEVLPQYQIYVNNRQAMGLNHIAFQGSTREELRALVEELKKKNIKILTEREDEICFEDPNSFAVEIYTQEMHT